MYRLLIVENERSHVDILRHMVLNHPRSGELSLSDVRDIPELERFLIDEGSPDILMMDIELGASEMNGIDVVKRHFPSGCGTQVVYVTGYVEYCTSVYRTDHVYFLAKPVEQDDFNDALDRAFERLEADANRPISVRMGGRNVLIAPRKITYVESDKRKVRIHVGTEVLEEYATLASLAEELPTSFAQCHKSFLVNMDCISEFNSDSILLSTGEVIPISQKKRKEMKQAFFLHLKSRL